VSGSFRSGIPREVLVDNNLSPTLAKGLNADGHDAIHLRDVGLQAATDEVVLARAAVEGRVLISADTDFGGLLSRSGAASPSVLLIRRLVGRRAAEQLAIIEANLDQVSDDLNTGAIVVLSDEWVRIRRLPL
jgi:predicted nuclease of predicted toxin-antitoxin system